jgi:hypothetical protein
MFVKEVWMTMKKILFSGLVIVGLTSASAWARVDPFAVVPVAPAARVATSIVTTVTVTASTSTSTLTPTVTSAVTRPPLIAPLRPPLISPIR